MPVPVAVVVGGAVVMVCCVGLLVYGVLLSRAGSEDFGGGSSSSGPGSGHTPETDYDGSRGMSATTPHGSTRRNSRRRRIEEHITGGSVTTSFASVDLYAIRTVIHEG